LDAAARRSERCRCIASRNIEREQRTSQIRKLVGVYVNRVEVARPQCELVIEDSVAAKVEQRQHFIAIVDAEVPDAAYGTVSVGVRAALLIEPVVRRVRVEDRGIFSV
jgi:hypothetical protein